MYLAYDLASSSPTMAKAHSSWVSAIKLYQTCQSEETVLKRTVRSRWILRCVWSQAERHWRFDAIMRALARRSLPERLRHPRSFRKWLRWRKKPLFQNGCLCKLNNLISKSITYFRTLLKRTYPLTQRCKFLFSIAQRLFKLLESVSIPSRKMRVPALPTSFSQPLQSSWPYQTLYLTVFKDDI